MAIRWKKGIGGGLGRVNGGLNKKKHCLAGSLNTTLLSYSRCISISPWDP